MGEGDVPDTSTVSVAVPPLSIVVETSWVTNCGGTMTVMKLLLELALTVLPL